MLTTQFPYPNCVTDYLIKESKPAIENGQTYEYYCPNLACRYKIVA